MERDIKIYQGSLSSEEDYANPKLLVNKSQNKHSTIVSISKIMLINYPYSHSLYNFI